jgi:hypothetical protein
MPHLNPPFPFNLVFVDVAERLPHLPAAVFRGELLDHVAAEAAIALTLENYPPTYYVKHFAPQFGRRPLAMTSTLEALLYELEMAAACCFFAEGATGAAVRKILKRALTHCQRFDDIHAEERHKRAKRNLDRWRGGKARHARNECVRLRAARLVWTQAPAGGWKTPAQAASAIEAHLIPFVNARRRSIVCGCSFRRTIVRWIQNHPAVRAAYLTRCTIEA